MPVQTSCRDEGDRFKLHVCHGAGIAPADHRLQYGGKPLADGLCLSEYMITKGSTLHLTATRRPLDPEDIRHEPDQAGEVADDHAGPSNHAQHTPQKRGMSCDGA